MSDAFSDILDESDSDSNSVGSDDSDDTTTADEQDSSSSASDSQTTTVTDSTFSGAFTDRNVRTNIPEEDGMASTPTYKNPETGEEADNVDPRGLFGQATLNELRYYFRQGPYGKTVVKKPIYDAFKYGFDITGDNTERDDDEQGKIKDFLETYHEPYVDAKIKSRRDGLAVLMFQFSDSASSAAKPIEANGDADFDGLQVWTLDNLSDELSESTVEDHTKYDRDQIYVSKGSEHGGVAIVDDINSPDHGEVVGYGIEPRADSDEVEVVSFLHASRCQHFINGKHVDGDLGNDITGKHVGESVLTPILQPIKATHMGFWAIKNILYRYSAPLHAVEPPEGWGQEDFDDAREKMGDLSMMSDAVLPPGSELSVAEGVSEFDPEPFFDALINAVCAGTEFTKPVLEGTQTGTVSGSETDVKNYFNHVERLRTGQIAADFHEAVQMVARYDQSTVPRVSGPKTFEIDWGPLFKPSDIERAEGMVSVVTAATNGIKNYVLTPDEAREIVKAGWSEFDMDADIGDPLSEDDLDKLDRINLNEAGQGIRDNEPVNEDEGRKRGSPQMGRGGGQPEGSQDQTQPTSDDTNVIEELINETELTREDAIAALQDG